jgi:hypothetical protein
LSVVSFYLLDAEAGVAVVVGRAERLVVAVVALLYALETG